MQSVLGNQTHKTAADHLVDFEVLVESCRRLQELTFESCIRIQQLSFYGERTNTMLVTTCHRHLPTSALTASSHPAGSKRRKTGVAYTCKHPKTRFLGVISTMAKMRFSLKI